MRKWLAPFVAALAAVVFLTGGPGGIKDASAAGPGVSTINIVGLQCSSATTVTVQINWPTMNQGSQFIYWSSMGNTFAPGTYTAAGPYSQSTASAAVINLPVNATIYMMVGTVIGGDLWEGQTMTFSTNANCQTSVATNAAFPLQVLLQLGNNCGNPFAYNGNFWGNDWDDWNDSWNHSVNWNDWTWNGAPINWNNWNWNGGQFGQFGQYGGWNNGSLPINFWNANGIWNQQLPMNWNWNGTWDGNWASQYGFLNCQFVNSLQHRSFHHNDHHGHDHDHDDWDDDWDDWDWDD